MGLGSAQYFRISGDFDGKKLEWDCETIDYVPMRKIVAKMIEGPFKSWQITVEFEELDENRSKTSMTVDYDMPMGPLGSFMDKVKLKKIAERGMENGLLRVKALLEGTGSIPVYITLDAYRQILKEKERLNCSVSEAIVKIIQRSRAAEAITTYNTTTTTTRAARRRNSESLLKFSLFSVTGVGNALVNPESLIRSHA